jgi:hypothetical protein
MITKIIDFGEQGFLFIKDDGVFYFWCISNVVDEDTDWKRISQRLYNACFNEAKFYKQKNINVRYIPIE